MGISVLSVRVWVRVTFRATARISAALELEIGFVLG